MIKNKKLTVNQKNFLLDKFFENNSYAGWRNIATKLIEDGQCIVQGSNCIWFGGIGNFIKTSTAKDAVDCLLYEFDLEYFMDSELYKRVHSNYIDVLSNKK